MSGGKQTASAAANPVADRSLSQAAPLKPMPRLLLALSIIFALWVGGLVAMYITTVYPHRHDAGRNAPEIDR